MDGCIAVVVGREWRWAMDAPADIVAGALEQHVRMIHEFRGVPGVRPDRLAEGMQVRRGCQSRSQRCKHLSGCVWVSATADHSICC